MTHSLGLQKYQEVRTLSRFNGLQSVVYHVWPESSSLPGKSFLERNGLMKWVKTSRFLSSSIRWLWLLNASMLKILGKGFQHQRNLNISCRYCAWSCKMSCVYLHNLICLATEVVCAKAGEEICWWRGQERTELKLKPPSNCILTLQLILSKVFDHHLSQSIKRIGIGWVHGVGGLKIEQKLVGCRDDTKKAIVFWNDPTGYTMVANMPRAWRSTGEVFWKRSCQTSTLSGMLLSTEHFRRLAKLPAVSCDG